MAVVPRDKCAYVFDPEGNLLNKICEDSNMFNASYCCGKFGFTSYGKYAYITDENGNVIKRIRVGFDYNNAITMTPNGFLACFFRCALFDFDGNMKWEVDVGEVVNNPSYYKGYWYVADAGWKKLLIIKDGKIVNSKSYRIGVSDTAICGKYLVAVSNHYLFLYDLSDPEDPKEVWSIDDLTGGQQVAFSPDCGYIAVADSNVHSLKIYSISRKSILEKYYGDRCCDDETTAVAWRKDKLAVGLGDGRVYVYNARMLRLPFLLLPANRAFKGRPVRKNF